MLRWAITVAGLLALTTGCGNSAEFPTGRVHGRVTYKGTPVQEGVVSLYSTEFGVGASAELDKDGAYAIAEPLRAGKYAVTILPPAEPPPQEAIPVSTKKTYPNLPEKYRDPKKSGLVVDIREGDNAFDVDMTR